MLESHDEASKYKDEQNGVLSNKNYPSISPVSSSLIGTIANFPQDINCLAANGDLNNDSGSGALSNQKLPDQPHLNKLQTDNYEMKEKSIEY
jgi:hypothetical protein